MMLLAVLLELLQPTGSAALFFCAEHQLTPAHDEVLASQGDAPDYPGLGMGRERAWAVLEVLRPSCCCCRGQLHCPLAFRA